MLHEEGERRVDARRRLAQNHLVGKQLGLARQPSSFLSFEPSRFLSFQFIAAAGRETDLPSLLALTFSAPLHKRCPIPLVIGYLTCSFLLSWRNVITSQGVRRVDNNNSCFPIEHKWGYELWRKSNYGTESCKVELRLLATTRSIPFCINFFIASRFIFFSTSHFSFAIHPTSTLFPSFLESYHCRKHSLYHICVRHLRKNQI